MKYYNIKTFELKTFHEDIINKEFRKFDNDIFIFKKENPIELFKLINNIFETEDDFIYFINENFKFIKIIIFKKKKLTSTKLKLTYLHMKI